MWNLWSVALGGLVVVVLKVVQSLLFRRKRPSRPVFSLDDVRPPAPHVSDQKLRDGVLKQGMPNHTSTFAFSNGDDFLRTRCLLWFIRFLFGESA